MPNWSKAHSILLPTFSHRAMQGYHPMMLDIAEQMMLKWERLNGDEEIDVADDMTRLTLDTIGLCGFDYRFNSFYRDGNHPFVDAMVNTLETTMKTRGLPLETLVKKDQQRKLGRDVAYMNEMVDGIIRERRRAGASRKKARNDLLDYMLSGVDKKTGEGLDDVNIRYQCNTFLIAGHETTSGLLSFTTYFLLKNPGVLARAYEEVDRVLGPDPQVRPTYAQVNQLTYVTQILKESLRLWPTAAAYAFYPYEDTVIGGQFKLKRRHTVLLLAADAASGPDGMGRAGRNVRSGSFCARCRKRIATECIQAVRQRAARVHRPAVRDAGGCARDRDDAAALQAARSHELQAQGQGNADAEARRAEDESPPARGLYAQGGEAPGRGVQRRRGAGGRSCRPLHTARRCSSCSARISGHRKSSRGRLPKPANGTALLRHSRRSTITLGECPRRSRSQSSPARTTALRRTMRLVFCAGFARAPRRARSPESSTPCSAAAIGTGLQPTSRFHARSTSGSRHSGRDGSTRGAKAMREKTSTASSRSGSSNSGRPSARRCRSMST
jgi:hypothetical protein